MRISGIEPSSVILSQRKKLKKLKNNAQKVPKEAEVKRDGVIQREKEGDLTQSYDKTPYTNRKFENQRTTHTNATKNIHKITISINLKQKILMLSKRYKSTEVDRRTWLRFLCLETRFIVKDYKTL